MSKLGIIIPAHKDDDHLDILLESLEDQDFKDFSVVLVDDSGKMELKDRIVKHIEDELYSFKLFYEPREKGKEKGARSASMARNYGFDLLSQALNDSKMEYTLFIDSDCIMKPGILQNMVDVLDKNTDCDFVYGNYDFVSGRRYISRPFNPYVLRTFNYICTMSMMRASKFRGFNENLDFFQDWDLFYNLAKNGSKGYYLNEILFTTKEPTEDSISGNKLSIDEKCSIFRKENNIPDSKIVVSTMAAPLQAEQRAEMLGADFAGLAQGNQWEIYPLNLQFKCWEYTYMIGLFNYPLTAFKNHLKACYGKTIFHFIGTDVFTLFEKHPCSMLDRMKTTLEKKGVILLSNSKRLQNELKIMGINSSLVYTPMYKPERFIDARNLKKENEDFTVAVYYSDSPNMNYFNTSDAGDHNGGESNVYMLWEIAKALPHIKFKFFGGRAKFESGNVEFCGKIKADDMPNFIANCDTLVRSTIHDSNAHLPIQFMLAGKRVITSVGYDLGDADLGLSFQDILKYEDNKNETIDKIFQLKKMGNLKENELLRVEDFALNTMSLEKYKRVMHGIVNNEDFIVLEDGTIDIKENK